MRKNSIRTIPFLQENLKEAEKILNFNIKNK
jgi:hypothetical protein